MALTYAVTCPACSANTSVPPPRHSKDDRMGAARWPCAGCGRVLNVRWVRAADDKNVLENGTNVASVRIYDGATTKILFVS